VRSVQETGAGVGAGAFSDDFKGDGRQV
jgi:hypothetical protein